MSACSLSFLHCALASSQQSWMGPKLLAAPTTISRPTSNPSLSLVVEATARTRREDRTARHSRIRKKVEGTPERPRLSVFRSNKHLYVQVIDDTNMQTLASASTMQKPISEEFKYTSAPTILNLGEGKIRWLLESLYAWVAIVTSGGHQYLLQLKAISDCQPHHH